MLRRLALIGRPLVSAAGGLLAIVLLAAAPTGSLYVTSLPAAADVWIDGTYVGRTPVVADALTSGRHTVGVAKTGWSSLQVDATIASGQTSMTSVRLERERALAAGAGSLALHGIVTQSVRIDGVTAVRAPDGTYPASAGTHTIVASTARGRITRSITVWPQMRTDVLIAANESPARPAVVAPVEDYVPKSAIRVDGMHVVIRTNGHEAVATLGETTYRLDGRNVEYDSAPTVIGSRLYLPIELLTALGTKR